MTILITTALVLLALLLVSGAMMSRRPDQSMRVPLAPLIGDDLDLRDRLQGHVVYLAGQVGDRNLMKFDRLQAAAIYIERIFQEIGLQPRRIGYNVSGRSVANIEVIIPGTGKSSISFVVGAHYDTVPGTPGANDNASGVAALLELARALRKMQPHTTVRLVAFVNEEPPYFRTARMGSRVYAQQLMEQGVKVTGMLSLETIGYFTTQAGSQRFPLPLLSLFYPNRGDFIAFVGNLRSGRFLKKSLRVFRGTGIFPAEGLIAPGGLTGVGWSDHWAFWQKGWPAIMVTDTALFRDPTYHGRDDTPEHLDYAALTRMVIGLRIVIADQVGLASH